MFRKIIKLLIFLTFINYAYAAKEGTGYNRGLKKDNILEITKLLDSKKYKKAIFLLKKEIDKNELNAELYNLLGYAYRNSSNFDLSIESYKKALAINPNHLGAHNYIGITYLKIGNVDKSVGHLQKLKDLCKGKCKEYKSLKKELNNIIKDEN